jgi:hypothetical protein
MLNSSVSRRAFLGAVALGACAADEGWKDLFDGKSLNGWRPSGNPDSWKVVDGQLSGDGPTSHLFYTGGIFKNFELEAEAMARPRCNSGVYFHTEFQEKGFPQKGFEIQINNTALGEGSYRERKKTGSLYGVRNVYKQLVVDDEWFKMHIAVRGKNVQVRLNGVLVVDFNEATPPVMAAGSQRGRVLDRGTFALQCHDPGSKVRFRRIRMKALSDEQPAVAAPQVDDLYRKIITLGDKNYPLIDFHVHLKSGLTLEQALAKSRRDGINYGIAINAGKGMTAEDDGTARRFAESLKGQPCFSAMQAEGREWVDMITRPTAAKFDYIFTDSMTFTDNKGRRMRTWLKDEVGAIPDPQEFMDVLVDRTVGILEREPIDIYVNPTFLPDVIAADYDRLWTEARMKKVTAAAVKSGVAIELNNRYKLPSVNFIKMAKDAGCKFTFGSNNSGPKDLGRCEYGIKMVDECKLAWSNFWVPGAFGPKGVERNGRMLKA